MRLEMPDGTAILLVPHDEGVVVGTQGARCADGTLPNPSGIVVTGETAEMLGALVDAVEETEAEAILGSSENGLRDG